MFKLDMRLQGAAAALNVAQLLQALLLAAYVARRDAQLRGQPEQTSRGWSREALRGWGKYFKYAVPAAAMVGGRCGRRSRGCRRRCCCCCCCCCCRRCCCADFLLCVASCLAAAEPPLPPERRCNGCTLAPPARPCHCS
jgi:hypothetical protein